MSRHRKEMARRRRELGGFNYASLAEFVHRSVCHNTQSDGATWCLTYAIYGTAFLNRFLGTTHTIVGGKLFMPRFNATFEHFWTMGGSPDRPVYIDFAARHNAALMRTNLEKRGHRVPADIGDMAMPYYVGSEAKVRDWWEYFVEKEPTDFAVRTYMEEKRHWKEWLDLVAKGRI